MARNIQYINIIKEDKQLRIHSQVMQNKLALSTKLKTIMLPNKNMITNEALINIQNIKKSTRRTKIALLCEHIHQKALPSHLWFNSEKNYSYFLDANHSGIASKIYIDNLLKSFKDVKIDYLYSPYSILYNLVPDNACTKTLYVLIINDIMYMAMFKEHKISIIHRSIKLMSFSDIEQSSFYSSDEQKQTLFGQMYALELENALSSFIDEWYTLTSNHLKLDKVLIACNIKQVSNESIETIKDNIGFVVQYESIDINKYMLALNQVKNIQSFIPTHKLHIFNIISLRGIVKAYYNINKKVRKKGYIIALISGAIVYKVFPGYSSLIVEQIDLFFLYIRALIPL
jgi:hypothetical protein